MGEVYLADDTRLKRQVGLKVLPPDLNDDPQRLSRFRTEAEAAARLNYPNIAQIYSVEQSRQNPLDADVPPSTLDSGLATRNCILSPWSMSPAPRSRNISPPVV